MNKTFCLDYIRIDMPGGGPCRVKGYMDLPKSPSEITIRELKNLVLDWAQHNTGNAKRIEIITPLEENDDDRTLENWVESPTEFQKENLVVSENTKFQKYYGVYGVYGKWTINIHY